MRIIGGELRGRQIIPPANFKARPTTDFAKEGLFNVLSNQFDFSEIAVLDLFAGTGSITYEFASRGCTEITTVEMNHIHSSFIKSTVLKLNLKGVNVVRHNVFDFLDICRLKYNIIFADPPYNLDNLSSLPGKILSSGILHSQGLLILEHPASYSFEKEPHFKKEKKYGNVHFSFFSQE